MKIVVTGACGQLGYDVSAELKKRGHNVAAVDIDGLDITDKKAVRDFILRENPDALIHCAAWTAVDAAEDAKNKSAVYSVNFEGTKNIAEVCRETGCKMLYISTDYVFGGEGEIPWQADCKDFNPLGVYGDSKLKGEFAVSESLEKFFIVRISWAFGLHGNNFVKTMLNIGKKYDSVRIVNDQIGTPTYTRDLAALLADMAESDKYGYYHASNEGGYISWYDFACEIFSQAGYNTKAVSVTTEEYGLSKAARPKNSRLDKSKLAENGFKPLPDWKDALKRYLEELKNESDKG